MLKSFIDKSDTETIREFFQDVVCLNLNSELFNQYVQDNNLKEVNQY